MYYQSREVPFNVLQGKTLVNIEGAEKDSGEIIFTCSDGEQYKMYHEQDCCEQVYIEDICGDVNCLIGNPILKAEEASNSDEPPLYEYDSYTWTYYNLATIKGYVTIRWYGSSNGYYSEEVTLEKIN